MDVAVIIALYNGSPWIGGTLESVFSQEVLPAEVVVVDDGSTDASVERVRGFSGVHLIEGNGSGSVAARNAGLAHSSAPLVAFLDHDDLWHPGHLRLLRDGLERYPEAGGITSSSLRFWEQTPRLSALATSEGFLNVWAGFPFGTPIGCPSAVLLRRQALSFVGGWEKEHTGIGDMLLWLKLSCHRPFVHLNVPTVAYRQHEGSQKRVMRKDALQAFDLRIRMSERALVYRREIGECSPAASDAERRLAALMALRDLGVAILEDRREVVVTAARRLEHTLGPEPASFLRLTFYCLLSTIHPLYDAPQCADRTVPLRYLLNHWPSGMNRTRKAIEDFAAEVEVLQ